MWEMFFMGQSPSCPQPSRFSKTTILMHEGTRAGSTQVALMPSHANHPPEIAHRIDELLALGGFMGGILETDDCRRDFELLRSRGIEFTEEPEERFYGIDSSFRDPSGIPWRLTQPAAVMGEAPAV